MPMLPLRTGIRPSGRRAATLSDVRAYAGILVNDHASYSAALRNPAAAKGITVPSGLVAKDRKRLDALAHTRAAGFNAAFVREARRTNSDAILAFRKEAARSADPTSTASSIVS